MKITRIENGYVRITPAKGKALYYENDKTPHSEAIVKPEIAEKIREGELQK